MTKKKKYIFIKILILFILIYFIIGFINPLKVTHIDYTNSKIPTAFDGYKIVQISDLHCKNFGKEQSSLINLVKEANPDLIVLTGDIVDEDHEDLSPVMELLTGILDLAPIYYVTGNHELEPGASKNYSLLLSLFSSYNITNMEGDTIKLKKENSYIYLHGEKYLSRYVVENLPKANTENFNILLYHGSDNFDILAPYGYDLVFSGHAHGGIIRLPFLGGIVGNEGMFPKYSKGMYQEENSTLISSAGLGDASLPRFYNRPEVVVVTLHSK